MHIDDVPVFLTGIAQDRAKLQQQRDAALSCRTFTTAHRDIANALGLVDRVHQSAVVVTIRRDRPDTIDPLEASGIRQYSPRAHDEINLVTGAVDRRTAIGGIDADAVQ